MSRSASELTQLLDEWSDGDPEALDHLMPLVVDELRQIARRYMVSEDPGHTLQPTALVNEVYLHLAGRRAVQWQSRAQFFDFMAELMRRILVDHARTRKALKRGGGATRLPLDESIVPPEEVDQDVLAVDEALESLAALDPRQSRIVELRYFAGLTIEETAEVLGIGLSTVKRDWKTAKLWLKRELNRSRRR